MIDDANIWRFNVTGSKEVRDYRVTGNYVCDNTQSALELARNHLGIVFAPDKSVQSDLQDGTLVACFLSKMNGGWIWWQSSASGSTSRGECNTCLMKCYVNYATNLLRRTCCGPSKHPSTTINGRDRDSAPNLSCVTAPYA